MSSYEGVTDEVLLRSIIYQGTANDFPSVMVENGILQAPSRAALSGLLAPL